jgi:hypothetical protein
MLAFRDKATLVEEISGALKAGGRFAFTLEEGPPLSDAERARMPDADTVWLSPLPEMLAGLERAGLVVRWQEDCSSSHRAVADSLIEAFVADAAAIAAQIGARALEELLMAHRLWSDWLREGRVRKLAFVAEKAGTARPAGTRLRSGARGLETQKPSRLPGFLVAAPAAAGRDSQGHPRYHRCAGEERMGLRRVISRSFGRGASRFPAARGARIRQRVVREGKAS